MACEYVIDSSQGPAACNLRSDIDWVDHMLHPIPDIIDVILNGSVIFNLAGALIGALYLYVGYHAA